MMLDDFTHKRESQASRLFIFLLSFANYAIEFFPNPIFRFRGNAVTAIFNRESDSFSFKRS